MRIDFDRPTVLYFFQPGCGWCDRNYEAVLALLVAQLGAGRIAMGSDYPYPLGELDVIGKKGLYPGHLVEHSVLLTPAQKQRILSGTAKEWLAWK